MTRPRIALTIRVAKACEGFGQRVQKSVFECILNAAQMEQLRHRLRREMDLEQDSLRIYRLRGPREKYLQIMGQKPEFDLVSRWCCDLRGRLVVAGSNVRFAHAAGSDRMSEKRPGA